ncbi:MAG TPA: family 16 glycosylhydrolase [Ignavibacteriaceae bacterium]|nr:family 16 glycosylhydrolase [Ignavibacteriaceae bacterium]
MKMNLAKYVLIILLSLIFNVNLFSQNYQLVWSDEFNGTSLNTNDWTYEIGPNPANNELQYYTNRIHNLYLEDGSLVIRALSEIYGGMNYTSARIKTKLNWKYGKIEARIKLPYGQGIWPAFWMLGQNINSVGWPACGEIDIVELVGGGPGRDNRCYATLHWEQNGHASYGSNYTLPSGIFADDYHIFTATWTPQKVECFVDGIRYFVIDITPAGLSEFHAPYFIILNLAVGGNWPGNPNSSTIFPQYMYVDYVRVYQDAASVPTVVLTAPQNNAIIPTGQDVIIKSGVQFSGEIAKVEFYQDAVKIGETSTSPYEWKWRTPSPGCYKLSAKAYSSEGFYSKSQTVSVKIGSDCIEAPYSGNPINIPGIIETENFNVGGQGIAYNDLTPVNSGGSYRTDEGVDIQECSDVNGGYNIGWVSPSEWLNYFVNISETAEYNFEVRYSSASGGGSLHIEIDGVNVTGPITLEGTIGWQTWNTAIKENIALQAGVKNLRIVVDSGEFNLNKIEVYKPNTTPSINLISPNGGEILENGNIYEIQWESLKIKDVQIGLSTNNGSSWAFVSSLAPSEFGVYRWKVPNISSSECKIMITDKANASVRDISESVFTINNVNSTGDEEVTLNFNLEQNYPNPFNPTTKISFTLNQTTHVTLKIFDLLGGEVASLVNEQKSQGHYEFQFDSSEYDLKSGIYIYRLTAGEKSESKKFVLLK